MVTSANSPWAWRRAVGGSIKCYKRPIEAILAFWLSEDYRTVVHKRLFFQLYLYSQYLQCMLPAHPFLALIPASAQILIWHRECSSSGDGDAMLGAWQTKKGTLLINTSFCCLSENTRSPGYHYPLPPPPTAHLPH